MALGGGTFTGYDKVLPGSYINIVSGGNVSVQGVQGVVAMPLELDWGPVGEVFKVTAEDFADSCLEIFGCDRSDERMKGLRDLFCGAQALYVYRVANAPQKAECDLAEALYPGTGGNSIRITVSDSVDEVGKKVVTTYVGSTKVDTQTVEEASELKANRFVTFKTPEAGLTNSESMALTGGTNGSAVTGTEYKACLDALESYAFSVLACDTMDETVKAVFKAYTIRMNEETGAKFQCVLHNYAADCEGMINVATDAKGDHPAALVYWVAGAQAGCPVGDSITNAQYDGEYEMEVNATQKQLRDAIQGGKFVFHLVDDEIHVLKDINSMVTTTAQKSDIFKDNKTVRIVNRIALDVAAIFNQKYIGIVPNDDSGRVSLWSELVTYHQNLQQQRAIENFAPEDLTVTMGTEKGQVVITDCITVTGTMEQLYMTVVVQ